VQHFVDSVAAREVPFGEVDCMGGWDEQALATIHGDWLRLSNRYNAIPWHLTKCADVMSKPPCVLHYIGADKPWSGKQWTDFAVWHDFKRSLDQLPATTCSYCALVENMLHLPSLGAHPMIDKHVIVCPRLSRGQQRTSIC
jgi:lipopolysaccharide biosynthesis glycosyltransferase